MSCSKAAAKACSPSASPSRRAIARANNPRRTESCHRLRKLNCPQRGLGIRLNTALQSVKFLIVRTPTSVIAWRTLETSREKPK